MIKLFKIITLSRILCGSAIAEENKITKNLRRTEISGELTINGQNYNHYYLTTRKGKKYHILANKLNPSQAKAFKSMLAKTVTITRHVYEVRNAS